MKHKEYRGQCSYHWGEWVNGLRVVRLTADYKEWQEAQLICAGCRKHLLGFFKYAKEVKQ
jgi:hypothetical protein